MAISSARILAFDILVRVETKDAYASDLLHAELTSGGRDTTSLKPEDAALATELTMGVLRWQGLLDFLLERELRKPISKLDSPVALALRLGLYQIRFLERVPARAAVNDSVELVKRARKSSAATLVNAVLRRCAEKAARPVADDLPPSLTAAERLGILHSHPVWLIDRWLTRFGELPTLALLAANNRPPRLTCALHDSAHRDEITHELEAAGLHTEPGLLLRSAFAVSRGSITRTEVFRRGAISIQDEASQIIPLLLEASSSHRVLDLCAAPGGKTAILARLASSHSLLVAADLHAHRLRAMHDQFERLHLPNVRLIQLDATTTLPFGVKFDRILVDAPCSGTGTLARHPEIRWRLKPQQLAEFHRLQTAILAAALDALSPGGRLVYSTCSLEPEENEDVISAISASRVRALSSTELSRSLRPALVPDVDPSSFFDSAGHFRTLPGTNPCDGFFAAVLEKNAQHHLCEPSALEGWTG